MEEYSIIGNEAHRNFMTYDKGKNFKEEFKKAEVVLKLNKSRNFNKNFDFC